MITMFLSYQRLVTLIFVSCDVLEMDYFTATISLFTLLWGWMHLEYKSKTFVYGYILRRLMILRRNLSFVFLLDQSSGISPPRNALVIIQALLKVSFTLRWIRLITLTETCSYDYSLNHMTID